jgi:hypothetical protein
VAAHELKSRSNFELGAACAREANGCGKRVAQARAATKDGGAATDKGLAHRPRIMGGGARTQVQVEF